MQTLLQPNKLADMATVSLLLRGEECDDEVPLGPVRTCVLGKKLLLKSCLLYRLVLSNMR